jgi:hypothetical protein
VASQGRQEARTASLRRDRRFAALCLAILIAGLAIRANADGFDLANRLSPLPLTGYDLVAVAAVGFATTAVGAAVRRSFANRRPERQGRRTRRPVIRRREVTRRRRVPSAR